MNCRNETFLLKTSTKHDVVAIHLFDSRTMMKDRELAEAELPVRRTLCMQSDVSIFLGLNLCGSGAWNAGKYVTFWHASTDTR